MIFNDPEYIKKITPYWDGERLPDGRPKVSDDILRRMRKITFEEAWHTVYHSDYPNNWECNFRVVHEREVMVGRAVTAVLAPARPDLDQAMRDIGTKEEGYHGFYNQWVIDNLIEDDVVVVDLYDKLFRGTYVGGNLTTAIKTRTKRGGAVIWGGIRDLQQIVDIEDINIYYRGVDPTGIGDCIMTGYNTPCRIGRALCMPGDVVMGTMSGVLFIPPQLAEQVVVNAEKAHIKDVFGFDRLASKTYSTAQIDRPWTEAMTRDFIHWFQTDERAQEYAYLTWDKELEEAIERDKTGEA